MKWGKMKGISSSQESCACLFLHSEILGFITEASDTIKKPLAIILARGIFSHKRFIENIHNCDIASPYCFQMVLYL